MYIYLLYVVPAEFVAPFNSLATLYGTTWTGQQNLRTLAKLDTLGARKQGSEICAASNKIN